MRAYIERGAFGPTPKHFFIVLKGCGGMCNLHAANKENHVRELVLITVKISSFTNKLGKQPDQSLRQIKIS